jgi:hypothetical protein
MQNEWSSALRAIWSSDTRTRGNFEELVEVELDGMDYGVYDDYEPRTMNPEGANKNIVGVMALPNLKRLVIRGVNAGLDDIDDTTWPVTSKSSGVKVLSLLRSSASVQSMRILLETCKSLDEFHLEVQQVRRDYSHEATSSAFGTSTVLSSFIRALSIPSLSPTSPTTAQSGQACIATYQSSLNLLFWILTWSLLLSTHGLQTEQSGRVRSCRGV